MATEFEENDAQCSTQTGSLAHTYENIRNKTKETIELECPIAVCGALRTTECMCIVFVPFALILLFTALGPSLCVCVCVFCEHFEGNAVDTAVETREQ